MGLLVPDDASVISSHRPNDRLVHCCCFRGGAEVGGLDYSVLPLHGPPRAPTALLTDRDHVSTVNDPCSLVTILFASRHPADMKLVCTVWYWVMKRRFQGP